MDNLENIQRLAQIAMEGTMSKPVNWQALGVTQEDIFMKMSSSVIEQIEQVPEDQRAVVAMATMTKLLVENFVLTAELQGNTDV